LASHFNSFNNHFSIKSKLKAKHHFISYKMKENEIKFLNHFVFDFQKKHYLKQILI